MQTKNKSASKVKAPEFFGKHVDCTLCGGTFKVTNSNQVYNQVPVTKDGNYVYTVCPYCGKLNRVDSDPHANFRAHLNTFIRSQIKPIKSIEDENVRLPMEKLLDDFNRLVQDY